MDTNNYHGENAIIQVIIAAIKSMLADFGLDNSWQVVRSNQPTIQQLENNTVYVDIISKRRVGTQGTKPVKTDAGWQNASVWFEQMLVQIGAFKQRDPDNDTSDTLTSGDVIGYLQGCVNANNDLGISTQQKNKYGFNQKSYFVYDWLQVIRSNTLRVLDYETDSGLKEKFPQFEFDIVIEQQLIKGLPNIDAVDVHTALI